MRRWTKRAAILAAVGALAWLALGVVAAASEAYDPWADGRFRPQGDAL